MSTVHRPLDVRIYHKECRTLAEAGLEVAYVVPAGQPVASDSSVHHRTLPPARSRLERGVKLSHAAYREALATGATVFHFHDPELIPIGMWLKAKGKSVVYDVHEDLPRQILDKPWIPPAMRPAVSKAAGIMEAFGAMVFDAIVAATPDIASRFPSEKTTTIYNYPLLSEFPSVKADRSYSDRPFSVTYVGGLYKTRGVLEMVEAAGLVAGAAGPRLVTAGSLGDDASRQYIEEAVVAGLADHRGWIGREEIQELYTQTRAGLVVLHPERRFLTSYPVKMFEYMAAGLPVIASDFPLWRGIIEEAQCGLLVDPLDPHSIKEAIEWVFAHPEEAEAMGKRGKDAVHERYNWSHEAKKLVNLYQRLLS
jgi:glycosyltransferase involved in cell wall biosynthesis